MEEIQKNGKSYISNCHQFKNRNSKLKKGKLLEIPLGYVVAKEK